MTEYEQKTKFCPFKKSNCVGELCGIWVKTNFKNEINGDCAFAILGQDAQERLK